MKSKFSTIIFLFCLIVAGGSLFGQNHVINFIPNKGQWQHPFLFKGESPSADFYLKKSGITYVVGATDNPEKIRHYKERATPPSHPITLNYHAYNMKWLDANPHPKTIGSSPQNYYVNYYLGDNPMHWKSHVSVFRDVKYIDLYPNINFYITSMNGLPEYEFIIKPGGQPKNIRLQFSGLNHIALKNGNLILTTSVGQIKELKPYAYQYKNGERQKIPCHYSLKDSIIEYTFPKGYHKTKRLFIDPSIIFATLTGSTSDNWGFTATYDKQGHLYAGGIVNGNGYPTTTGAFQLTFGGGTSGSLMPCDISISKFNTNGTALIYSTYLGGDGDEMPHSLVVNSSGDLIVAGKTLSDNFPTTASAYDPTYNGGYDIIISKFNASGTNLLASTYLGGSGDDGVNVDPSFYGDQNTIKYNYGDGSRSEVIVDKSHNIYLAASTQSTNFPYTSSAFSNSLGGQQDGVFVKMNSNLSQLIYSTYLGGSNNDAAYVLALDTNETHVYVGGGTASNDFGGATTNGAWESNYQGGIADGFICKFNNGGSYMLQRTTFIGTSNYDQVYGLKTDLKNGVYALGQTLGNFPVSAGVYSNPGSPQFIIKLNDNLNSRIYSTVFGSGPSAKPNISPVAFMVDTCQNVYVSGWASGPISPGSSTNGMPITNNAFQSTTDGSDFYFAVFSRNAQDLLFGSFFGSSGKEEHVDGGTSRFDPDGIVYQAICASCGRGSAFPATPGAYATQKGSNNCNLGAVKIAFDLGSVDAQANATPDSGCVPLTVQFVNNSANGVNFHWDFGDGGSSTTSQPSHTYNSPGNYRVMLTAHNPNSCHQDDTTYLMIHVSADTINANFDFALKDTCSDPYITLQNNSSPLHGSSLSNADFHWSFGDGQFYSGQNPPNHHYASPGTYQIQLIMIDPDACNSPDTIIKSFTFEQKYVIADFDLPDTLCEGRAINFQNNSENGQQYYWDFGDGGNSSNTSPNHTYHDAGTFKVILIASNSATCNKQDSMEKRLTISPSPTAAFTTTPEPPKLNVPTSFHNQSQDATHYYWDFGDKTHSTEANPVHQFPKTGSYQVCLTAYNNYGCQDKVCQKTSSEVQPLADLPTAFSPNGDGHNDILFVRGYAIADMDLKIFNRWGEMVFESHRQNKGWDGTYQGKPQPIDAYAYILSVTFLDGSHYQTQGNVTLLR